MKMSSVLFVSAIAAVWFMSYPASGLAQAQCSAAQPRLAPEFADLATRLGARVGDAAACEHADSPTADLQQSTTTGLLYLRRGTNTPTFTDGGQHWAVRDGQLLEWSTADVDPPQSSQLVSPTQASAAPTTVPRAIVASTPSLAPGDLTGLALATTVTLVLIALAATLGLTMLRRRPGTPNWVVQPGTQLATATAPVTALEGAITNIGDGRVTAYAEDILTRDAEPMVVQQRPFALAVLLPAIVKWLLVVVLGLALAIAFGQALYALVPLAVAAIALALAYAPLSATDYRVTSQRVEITTGLMAQRKVTRELYELGDATIERPFHYRFFGVGDLTIQHRSGGAVVLQAIHNAEVVRDLLRGSGQHEGARLDRARWR